MTDSSQGATTPRSRIYLELRRAEIGWRYQILVGITEVKRGWRPTWKWARNAGRRARRPFLSGE